jgi:hypothetical protein
MATVVVNPIVDRRRGTTTQLYRQQSKVRSGLRGWFVVDFVLLSLTKLNYLVAAAIDETNHWWPGRA